MIQEQSSGRHFIGSEIVSQSLNPALLNCRVTPTLLVETAGGQGEGTERGAVLETMKQGCGGIHGGNCLPKEEDTEAENSRRTGVKNRE